MFFRVFIIFLLVGEAAISDMDGLSPEEFYEMKVQDILDIIHVVRGHMTKARQLQVSKKKLVKLVDIIPSLFSVGYVKKLRGT